VPTDDEFRRVAEDVRALVRSLVRDVRSGVDEARREANRSSQAIGDEMRKAARQSRQNLRAARGSHSHPHHRHGWDATPPGSGVGSGIGSGPGSGVGVAEPPRPVRPPRPPRPAKTLGPLRHRHDSSTVLGLVALILGLSWLAAATHLLAVPWKAAVAVALMVLGAAMVVTARTDWALSRRAWPMLLGVLLVAILALGTASISWPSVGSHDWSWTSWSAVPATVNGGVGTTTVDLRPLPSLQSPVRLEVDRNIGMLRVFLPRGVAVAIDESAGIGSVIYNGRRLSSGVGQHVQQVLNPSVTGPLLTLVVHGAVGTVRIEQAAA
jgi:hypothetical protein